jgi:CheY-like chemotaxis protein
MREQKKIMVVDDDNDVVVTYQTVFQRMGYGVETARDGGECLEKIGRGKPDLILLDVLLPVLSGSEVCRKLKEEAGTRDIPVVAITASLERGTRLEMTEVGADEFLLKPVDVSDLNRVVKKHLGV